MDLGRIFHFVLPNGSSKDQCRPFLIVREWSPGMANGLVFLDGLNDHLDDGGNAIENPAPGQAWAESALVAWITSVGRSKTAQPRTWHRWEDCPVVRKDETPAGPAFINVTADVVNGNPDLTHVFNAGGIEIPWPVGMTLSQALRAWASTSSERGRLLPGPVAATSGQA